MKTTMEMTTQEQMEMEITVQEQATTMAIGKKRNGHAKPVLCITDGKTFASATDAAKYYGAYPGNIAAVCRGVTKTYKGMKFCYVDNVKENLPVIAEEIQVKDKRGGSRKARMVKCVETGMEYSSTSKAAKKIGVSPSKMWYHLNGKVKHINGNHYVFVEDECAECIKEMTEIVEKASTYDSLIEKIKLLEDCRLECQSYRNQYKDKEHRLQYLKTEMNGLLEDQRQLDENLITKSKLVQDLETEIKNMLNL